MVTHLLSRSLKRSNIFCCSSTCRLRSQLACQETIRNQDASYSTGHDNYTNFDATTSSGEYPQQVVDPSLLLLQVRVLVSF